MDVLVVEDEPIARLALEQTLTTAGYRVTSAKDGVEALSLLKQDRHQLVVSDWRMPNLDGASLCQAIRSSDLQRYVYFIMVTSVNDSCQSANGFSQGIDDYIVKPYNPLDLLMRVNVGRRILQVGSNQLVVFALARLAESRDPEMGGHLERVQQYCRELSIQLRVENKFRDVIDDAFIRMIYLTSPLHDIGKVSIPDSILLHPGKLTAEQFEIMKTHTTNGAETLEAAIREFPHIEFLSMGKDIAMYHHERYDGTGYPLGLRGNEIPLAARIVAVADVYDALTSKRVYKDAIPHADAMDIVRSAAGTHLDGAIVDAFFAIEQRVIEIAASYRDPETPSVQIFDGGRQHD